MSYLRAHLLRLPLINVEVGCLCAFPCYVVVGCCVLYAAEKKKKKKKKKARGGGSRNPDTVISIANCFSRGRGAALNCVYVVKSRLLTRQVTDTFHGLGVSYIR
jgi:hypothetical protein